MSARRSKPHVEPQKAQFREEASHLSPSGDLAEDLRMTLNKRLATAAAAIVHRMINRSRPRVFRPVSPFKKGSNAAAVIVGVAEVLE